MLAYDYDTVFLSKKSDLHYLTLLADPTSETIAAESTEDELEFPLTDTVSSYI